MKGKILIIMGLALLLSACTKKETIVEEGKIIITTTPPSTTAAPPVLTMDKPAAPSIFTTEKPAAQTGGNVIEIQGTPAVPRPTEPTTTVILPPRPAPVEAAPAQAAPTIPAEPPVQPPTAVEVKTGSTTEKVGVLDCDNFIDKYVSCLGQKVPTDARKQLELNLDNSIRQWQAMAKTPQGETDVKNACRNMNDTTRQAMAVYGCAW